MDDAAVGIPGDSSNGSRAGAVDLYLSGGGAVSFATPSVRLFGAGPNDNAGVAVAPAGDVNGDGYADVIVGSAPSSRSVNRTGVAWLVHGSPNAGLAYNLKTQAAATLTGANYGDEFGATVSGVGDVNGDGFDDVAVGAPGADANGVDAGAAFIFYGPLSGTRAAISADRVHPGAEAEDRAGFSIVGLGDTDGDSYGDYAVGAPMAGPGISADGAVYIVTATTPGVTSLGDAAVIVRGINRERLGWSLAAAGDHNDDDVSELWAGSRQWGGAKRGAVSLLDPAHGAGEQAIGDVALARIHGRTAADYLGTSVAGGVDFDADGFFDVIMGADTAEAVYAQSGAAWVAFGPFSGDTIVTATTGRIAGGGSGGLTGASLAAFPDLNGDGFADVIVGSPGANPAGKSTAGAASVFYGGADLLDLQPFYLDADHDGWGGTSTQLACVPSPGFVTVTGDCNDASSAYHPFAPETVCGDLNDYSCDGSVGSVDADNDGVYACANDCADDDPTVAAGLPERCGNDKDDDCNGHVDDSLAVDAVDWRPDGDEDGFGDDNIVFRACTAPGFFLTPPVTVGGDCEDSDFAIKPGAPEVCDEADNDCNGVVDGADALDADDWYSDDDGDGYGLLAGRVRACSQPEGTTTVVGDCDDSAFSIAPGNAEACDALDNDCDGWLYLGGPVSADDATWRLQGAEAPERFGQALTAIPDMDADGFDELVVSAPSADGGVVYVLSDPPTSGDLAIVRDLAGGQMAVRATIRGAHARGGFGAQVAGGDFDGDGVGDLAIAAPVDAVPSQSQGAVYVFYGPLEGELTSAQAGGVIIGVDGNDRLGTSIAVGDLNNDGADELILGAPGADAGFDRRGAVAVVQGSGARLDPDAPVVLNTLQRLVGTADRDELGQSVAVVGDVDGDGLPEVAAGAQLGGASDAGYVMIQTWGGFAEAGLPESVITGAGVAQRLGRTLAGGDVTGDGYADLLVSNALGRVWLVAGQAGGLPSGVVTDIEQSELRGATGVDLGAALAVAPDANGDGVDEIVVGAPSDDVRAANGGAVYLIYGDDALPALIQAEQVESFGRVDPGTTFPTYSAANFGTAEGARLQGSLPGAQLGTAVLTGFHSSNPGLGDIVTGAPGVQTGVGAVYGWATGPYATDMGSEGHPPGWITVMPDLDLDGQGDQFAPSISGCPMHAPIRFVNGVAVPASVTDGAPTDCDDSNPRIYLGAPDRAGDGIDQNCDGSDGGVDLPPVVSDCHVISSVDGDGVLVSGEQPQGVSTATDPEGSPVTVSYVWTIGEGTIVGTGEVLSEYSVMRGDYIRLRCTPTAGGQTGAEVSSPPVMVGNAPPSVDTCTIFPTPFNDHHTLYVAPKVTEPEGDPLTWTYTWTVNGSTVQSGASNQLDPSFSVEGDTIGLTCAASDGLATDTLSSTSVVGPQPADEPCDFTTAYIETQADVAYYEHCTTLLQVYVPPNASVTHVELPALTSVTDWVMVNESAALTSLSLPALTTVGNYLAVLNNPVLTTFSVPSLTSATQMISLQGNTSLCTSSRDWASLTAAAIVHDNGTCGAPCDSTSAFIYAQSDVAQYENCSTLNFLQVSGISGITSLNLPNLTTVHNHVYVDHNPNLTTVSLPALTSVGTYFYLENNAALTSLNMGSIQDVGTYSYLTNNTSLCATSVADWDAVSTDYAYLANNGPCVTPCDSTFASIYTQADVAQYQNCSTLSGLHLANTSAVSSVSLPNLTTVHGQVYFDHNPNLASVSLPNLTTVDSYFYFDGNPALTTLDASSITSVGEFVYLSNNPNVCVDTIADWEAISVDWAYVHGNGSCAPPAVACDTTVANITTQADVALYENCSSLLHLNLSYNSVVTSLNLPNLQTVLGHVYIDHATALESLDLPALDTVASYFYVDGNPALTSMDVTDLSAVGAYSQLTDNPQICIGAVKDWYTISHDFFSSWGNGACSVPIPCDALSASITTQADVAQYQNCTRLGGLNLTHTTAVTSVSLPNLEMIRGNVYLWDNPALTTLSMPNLVSIVGYFALQNSNMLSTVDLSSLAFVNNYAYLKDNPLICPDHIADWDAITAGPVTYINNGSCELPPAPCPGVYANITAPEDVAQYQHCTSLEGLSASSTVGINTLSLPNLVTLNGSLYLDYNSYMWTVDLPQLTAISGYVYLYNNSIDALLLPSLETVDGYFFMHSNGSMTTMNADSLAWVGVYTSIRFQPQLCVDAVAPWRAVTANHAADTSDNGSCGVDTDGDGLADIVETTGNFSDPELADTDGDGLDDLNEFQFGTNPWLVDTDGDDLADADEYAFGSAPTDPDTDNDGANDGEEWAESTDPNLADTDEDGLTDGDEDLWLTDPLVDDTDGGGRLDGFEVTAGLDPLDAADDYPPAKVLITEVVDHATLTGARFIELYNAGGQAQSLNGWTIQRYSNGNTTPTTGALTVTGTIPPGGFWVIAASNSATTGFPAAFGEAASQYWSGVSGNGDDVYVLTDGVDVVDQYGVVGEQPALGTSWNYTDSVARRVPGITDPNPSFTLSEWTITSGDTSALPFHRNYTPVGSCSGQSLYITDQASIEAKWHCTSLDVIYMGTTTNTVSLSLPHLQTLSGYVYLDNNAGLTAIDLPALTSVAGYFYVTNNTALSSLDVSSLTEVQAYSYITNNPSVCVDSAADWNAISLMYANISGNLSCVHSCENTTDGFIFEPADVAELRWCSSLTRVQLIPGVETIAPVTVLSFPNLVTVTGGFDVRNQTTLTTVSAPMLQTVGYQLYGISNSALSSWSMPSLQYASDVQFYGNPYLCETSIAPWWSVVYGYLALYDNGSCAVP